MGRKHTEETKKKMSDSHKGKIGNPHTEETKRKISNSLRGRCSPHKGCKGHTPSEETKKKIANSIKNMYAKKIKETPFLKLSWPRKKMRLIEEYNRKCVLCGQGEIWNGIKLVLQVDHVDGNNKNNIKDNLRVLCPNCHTQTDTYCNKNMTEEEAYKHRINTLKGRGFIQIDHIQG